MLLAYNAYPNIRVTYELITSKSFQGMSPETWNSSPETWNRVQNVEIRTVGFKYIWKIKHVTDKVYPSFSSSARENWESTKVAGSVLD